jgi:hypothetical protein
MAAKAKAKIRSLQAEFEIVAHANGTQPPSYQTCLNLFREHGYDEAKRLLAEKTKKK